MKRALWVLLALLATACPAQIVEPVPQLHPIEGPCFFDPLRNEACQQET